MSRTDMKEFAQMKAAERPLTQAEQQELQRQMRCAVHIDNIFIFSELFVIESLLSCQGNGNVSKLNHFPTKLIA